MPRSWLVAFALAFAASARAEDRDGQWLLHLNGASHHFNRDDLNERNWGAGATYEFNPTAKYVWALDGDYFRDSFGDPSGYIGGSWRRRFRFVDIGLIGFVMYRETARERIGTRIFPGALPFIEAGGRRLRVRAAYIPAVTGRDDEALTFQLLIRL
jgi:hypothetical protein